LGLLEAKMDWMSGLTGNLFVEEKTLRNTKANKMLYARLILNLFDTERLREMYKAQGHGLYRYKHVTGGDQADNRGMLLAYDDIKANSEPWYAYRNHLKKIQ
jgi:hypothetical protein